MRVRLLAALLFVPTVAAAAPSLDADLSSIRDDKAWFYREAFVGWTADHRVVYRSAVCDPDDGGGRGSYCEVDLCVAKADADAECTPLTSFETDTSPRAKVDVAGAKKAEADALAKLGALTKGTALPASSFRVSTAKKALSLVRGGKAGKGTIQIIDYSGGSMSERPQSVDSVKVTTATTDGTCVAAIGHFRFRSDYEGVPTRTPHFFGVVRCK